MDFLLRPEALCPVAGLKEAMLLRGDQYRNVSPNDDSSQQTAIIREAHTFAYGTLLERGHLPSSLSHDVGKLGTQAMGETYL